MIFLNIFIIVGLYIFVLKWVYYLFVCLEEMLFLEEVFVNDEGEVMGGFCFFFWVWMKYNMSLMVFCIIIVYIILFLFFLLI